MPRKMPFAPATMIPALIAVAGLAKPMPLPEVAVMVPVDVLLTTPPPLSTTPLPSLVTVPALVTVPGALSTRMAE